MASKSTRRRGSRQFWPRKRAQKHYAKIGSWASVNASKESNLLGFCGYKVGMTNIGIIDNFSNTLTKGTQINIPVTIIECPPIKILSLRFYGADEKENLQVIKEVSFDVKDKNLKRKIDVNKKKYDEVKEEDLIKFVSENDVLDIKVKVLTNPSLASSVGKKKPEILELGICGSDDEKIKFVLSKVGQVINASDVISSGELLDSHGITKGKGFTGAVKRFGVKLTSHTSEKKRRHAGNVGAWTPHRVLTTQPLPGQSGYHTRCEWNKWVLKVSKDPNEINPKQGFENYGVVKNEFILVKGSVQGPKKRLITFVKSIRSNPKYPKIAPEIVYINK